MMIKLSRRRWLAVRSQYRLVLKVGPICGCGWRVEGSSYLPICSEQIAEAPQLDPPGLEESTWALRSSGTSGFMILWLRS